MWHVAVIQFVYMVVEKEDTPDLIIFGMIPIFASMVIAVFASTQVRCQAPNLIIY